MGDTKKGVLWTILLWFTVLLCIAGCIIFSIWLARYDWETKKLFSQWIIDHKEEYDKLVILNPNFKPQFVFNRDWFHGLMCVPLVISWLATIGWITGASVIQMSVINLEYF